jgi:hypothetical protein
VLLAATLAAPSGPAAAALLKPQPPRLVLTLAVAENAERTMPLALWKRLVVAYVPGRTVATDEGMEPADAARCRAAHAAYAVAATFQRVPHLPGLGEDPRRIYGVARFEVRNCATGALAPAKTILLHSDPPETVRPGAEENVERMWLRAAEAQLAREPLMLSALAASGETKPAPSPAGTRATPAASPASSTG